MTELKPCPFCGGKAKIYKDYEWFFVECEDFRKCGSQTQGWTTEAEAIEAWNRREGEK